MKRISILLALLFSASHAWADPTYLEANQAKPTIGIQGQLPACLGPVNVEAVACDADGAIKTTTVSVVPGTNATFQAAGTAIAFGTLDATFRECINPVAGTKVVMVDNQTNGDIAVSMDAGTTNHFSNVRAGSIFTLNLAPQGLVTDAAVHVKDSLISGATAASAGQVICYAWK